MEEERRGTGEEGDRPDLNAFNTNDAYFCLSFYCDFQ